MLTTHPMNLRKYWKVFNYNIDIWRLLVLLVKSYRKKVLILDLDNTLFSTGDFTKRGIDFITAYKTATINERMLDYAIVQAEHFDHSIVLTARDATFRCITMNRVINELPRNKLKLSSVLMCPALSFKYYYLRILAVSARSLLLIDDLSGGHEKGVVIWHESEYMRLISIGKLSVESLNNNKIFNL